MSLRISSVRNFFELNGNSIDTCSCPPFELCSLFWGSDHRQLWKGHTWITLVCSFLLSLLVFSDYSSGNCSIALAEAAVVAGRGGFCPHRFTLSIVLHLYLISWCYRGLLGYGLFNFQKKMMWHVRVLICGTLNADGVRNLNCYNHWLCLSLKWV